jgi:O-antigen/teichoic acid export membrane protein
LSRAGKKEFEVHSLHAYAWPVFLAVLCFATLTNLDVTLAKHFLSPYDAGNYATVSLLGKIVFFLPGGIVIAMFPKTSELFESRVSPAPVMIKAVLFTLISAGFVVAIYGLFPDALVAFLFKDKYPLVAPHLFRYGLAMLFLTLANVLMSYFLSLNQTKVAWAVTIAVTVQLALMFAFHDSIEQIVNVVLVSAAFGLVLMSLFLFRSTKRCSQ